MHCRISPRHIVRIIAIYDPDVVELQALDANRSSLLHIDQALEIAGELNMNLEFYYRGKKFTMVNTHLGLTLDERKQQVTDLLGAPRFTDKKQAMILCGDFNSTLRQYMHWAISKVMNGVEIQFEKKSLKKTFPAKFPALRLDHICVANEVDVRDVIVASNQLTKVASDHLPLIADIEFGSTCE